MAKAILVMDMPKDCLHCELRMCIENHGKYYQHCGLDKDGYCLESFFKSEDLTDGFISERCPLKPMSEKREPSDCYYESSYVDMDWNACGVHMERDGNGKPLIQHCYNCKWKQAYCLTDLRCHCKVKHKDVERGWGRIIARLCKYYEARKE